MKIELRGRGTDIIMDTIKNQGVVDVEKFMHPNHDDDIPWRNYHNMERAIWKFIKHIEANSRICIIMDSDCDGVTSSAYFVLSLQEYHPWAEVEVLYHRGKEHGITQRMLDMILEYDYDLVVVPDAGTNDKENQMELMKNGIDVIVIDHHEFEYDQKEWEEELKETSKQVGDVFEPSEVILVNNFSEYNKESNVHLTGAGMVYKFWQGVDELFETNISEIHKCLVAIGQIADVSDISTNEVRSIVFEGISNINNPMILKMLEEFLKNKDSIAPIDISFQVSSYINSVCRIGDAKDKEHMFKAIVGWDMQGTQEIQIRRKNKLTGKMEMRTETWDKYSIAYRDISKIKDKQKSLVNKSMKKVHEEVDKSAGIAVAVVEATKEQNVNGLVAMKMSKEYDRPALCLQKREGVFQGSARGNEKTVEDFKAWCTQTGYVEVGGHANSFGITIPEDKLEDFIERAEEFKIEPTVYVDGIYDHISGSMIDMIDMYRYLFGGSVRAPRLAFKDITIPTYSIRFMKGNSVSLEYTPGVKLVMFGGSDAKIQELQDAIDVADKIKITCIGEANVNFFAGRKTQQIVMEDFEITPVEDDDWNYGDF